MMGDLRSALSAFALPVALCGLVFVSQVRAQNRGVYPLGMSATNSGVTPEPGFSYSNQLLIYSRDKSKGPDGQVLATGSNSVVMDMNTLAWVSKKMILGGARFSMTATLPVAKNSLTSDFTGPVSGGGGFADSYYQPFILGWNKERAAVRAVYGFLAPTGSFQAGANNNVGSGYWTHAFSSGQTFYLTKDRKTIASAFQMYEIHTTQKDTGIQPGQTFNLDFSLMRALPFGDQPWLQVGFAGYNQRQTTARRGPNVTPDQEAARYKVNALGFASNVNLPHRINVGFKYLQEFSNRSTFQGHSIQISGAIKF
ncbi:MAG TPA: transporter [Pyrinomonadaceae bacterium]|nr:transporter [Pyrinomonadaceae bacterium]